jgi:hypothetical protein
MTTAVRGAFLASACALVLPIAAAAQENELARRLDSQTLASVRPLLDSARVSGLPTAPLEAKALEGVAKRATSERIVSAVRLLLGELATARTALGAESSPAELAGGATALRVGAQAAALKRLRGAGRDLTVPLGVLTDLLGSGVPSDVAVEAIRALTARGATDADLSALAGRVRQDVSAGVAPGVAAATRARLAAEGPAAGRRPETPSRSGGRAGASGPPAP